MLSVFERFRLRSVCSALCVLIIVDMFAPVECSSGRLDRTVCSCVRVRRRQGFDSALNYVLPATRSS